MEAVSGKVLEVGRLSEGGLFERGCLRGYLMGAGEGCCLGWCFEKGYLRQVI